MIKNLADTVELMNSDYYKDRFISEYYQTKIRYEKLEQIIEKYKNGTLDFTPKSNIELLEYQLIYMRGYLNMLKIRAKIESITL